MTQPPVIQQERRHEFRRAGAIEPPSGRHQEWLSCKCWCQDRLAPARCENRLNATATPS
ncbi:TPA: hypothetical protein ACGB3D_005566 [Citrobacter freundii]